MNRLSHKRKKHLKHKLKAKGRHSIHSPFLFDIYENCIKNSNITSVKTKKKSLLKKIKFFKNPDHISKSKLDLKKHNFIICLSKRLNADLVFINGIENKKHLTEHYSSLEISNNSKFIIIDNIHSNKEATNAWEEIIKKENITLSVDFYYLGLISFSTDFTKQHFILKF